MFMYGRATFREDTLREVARASWIGILHNEPRYARR